MPGFGENNYPIEGNNKKRDLGCDGHIENRFHNLENKKRCWSGELDDLLESLSRDISNECVVTGKNLLNKDGTLNMAAFGIKKEGGFYDTETRKGHKKEIRDNEINWIIKKGEEDGGGEDGVGRLIGRYLLEKFDNEEVNKILEKYSDSKLDFWDLGENQKAIDVVLERFNKEKEKSFGILWEKAKTVLFNEFIGSDFLVVRTSTFDDQINGTDNLVINKGDGSVVGAFDEVTTDEESKFHKNKLSKVESENKKGGVSIDYGITIEENKIIKKQFKNIPIFALQISRSELMDLLEAICDKDENNKEKNDKVKKDIFMKILHSLGEQTEIFGKEENMKNNVNFINFLKSLDKIKEIVGENFPNKIE